VELEKYLEKKITLPEEGISTFIFIKVIVDYIIKSRSESFCAKPRQRLKSRSVTGRSTKRPFTLNDIHKYTILSLSGSQKNQVGSG
jgi:hypothetical protein